MTEDIDNNIEAIEREKEEYLENHSGDDEEVEVETEETEFSLTDSEIEEWIVKLTELKVEKNPIELEIDDETTLRISYEEDNEDDGGRE